MKRFLAAIASVITLTIFLGTLLPIGSNSSSSAAPNAQTVNTPRPTRTPKATRTPRPTTIPSPTRTPRPTRTPKPTRTPRPVTPTATPTEAPPAELSASVTTDLESAVVGDTVVYTVTVTNEGGTAADVTYIYASQGDISCLVDGDPVAGPEFSPPITLGPAAQVTCTITHVVGLQDRQTGRVSIEVQALDANFETLAFALNQVVEVGPEGGELSIAFAGDRSSAQVGDTVTFTATLNNTGPVAIGNLIFETNYPVVFGEQACTLNGNAADYHTVELAPGDVLVCDATYEVTPDDAGGEPLGVSLLVKTNLGYVAAAADQITIS